MGDMSHDRNVRAVVPFLWVRDIAVSLRFYVDGLGAAMMVQEVWAEGPHRNVPDGPVGLGVSIYFICDDALAIYRDVTSRGLRAATPFVGNGMWVTHVADPDGYHLYFESHTDAAEETVFSEHG